MLPNATLKTKVLRVGFFPNLTHPQALVLQALMRLGSASSYSFDFKKYLPEEVTLQWSRFNAGPLAMECLLTGNIDLSYVGPSPAVNLYMRTKGKEVYLIAGAVKGGSGLVLQPNFSTKNDECWENKKIATPQFGNTQDVACRAWFQKQGYTKTFMLPTANPDQLRLFQRKQVDGVWTIEPWLSRLIKEAKGQLFFYDKDNWTTLLVGSKNFCENKTLRQAITRLHEDLTQWIVNNKKQAAELINQELKYQTHLDFPVDFVVKTLENLSLETHVEEVSIQKWVDDAVRIQFLNKEKIFPLKQFFEFHERKDEVKSLTVKP